MLSEIVPDRSITFNIVNQVSGCGVLVGMTTKKDTVKSRPSLPAPRARDRVVDLFALLAMVAVSAIVYVEAGGLALVAANAASATLYALWRRIR
jgi:hypothetical protein